MMTAITCWGCSSIIQWPELLMTALCLENTAFVL